MLFGHQYRLGRTSALARRLMDLHGSWLTRYRVLVPLLVVARAARGLIWLARFNRRELPWLLAVFPVYLLALSVWTAGFARGAREALADKDLLSRPLRP